jgi:hypothetical protein
MGRRGKQQGEREEGRAQLHRLLASTALALEANPLVS